MGLNFYPGANYAGFGANVLPSGHHGSRAAAQTVQNFLDILTAEGIDNGKITHAQLVDYADMTADSDCLSSDQSDFLHTLLTHFNGIAKRDGDASGISLDDLVQTRQPASHAPARHAPKTHHHATPHGHHPAPHQNPPEVALPAHPLPFVGASDAPPAYSPDISARFLTQNSQDGSGILGTLQGLGQQLGSMFSGLGNLTIGSGQTGNTGNTGNAQTGSSTLAALLGNLGQTAQQGAGGILSSLIGNSQISNVMQQLNPLINGMKSLGSSVLGGASGGLFTNIGNLLSGLL